MCVCVCVCVCVWWLCGVWYMLCGGLLFCKGSREKRGNGGEEEGGVCWCMIASIPLFFLEQRRADHFKLRV